MKMEPNFRLTNNEDIRSFLALWFLSFVVSSRGFRCLEVATSAFNEFTWKQMCVQAEREVLEAMSKE